ncbi:hypothetical protein CBR_g23982 [Chara braunii]|uniref:BTB domain-containing protein n=1 Tax=Chara braunii TaxID=69332 RepID=A0A388L5G4_CHABU|nr:hypothetical protein CBR_g23982 [Chara braunii]|eukprot:GBG77537.1 hypothetical protein CBR_g23982 [Chara braunii]
MAIIDSLAGGGGTPSKSRNVTHTVNGSHQFTINGYSLAKGMGVGKYIPSDTFEVGGYKWAIYFYPDGKNVEDNSQYVSVFIALASDGNDVRALFELTLLDQSGKGKHKVHSHFDRPMDAGPYTLKYRGSMWGYKRFLRRAVLESSDYIKNDTLNITCTVGVVVSSMQPQCPKPFTVDVPESQLGVHFGALLESGEAADVTFDVDGELIHAHKLVLAARSPVFKAQLYGPLRETGKLRIVDVQPPVFRALLHFIYTDQFPDQTEVVTSSGASASVILAQHLLAAADMYGLDRLRLMCESKLCEEVHMDTVATTLALAEQHHAPQLKARCLKYVAANLKAVMQSDGFKHLRESCPSLQEELLRTLAGVDDLTTSTSSSRGRTIYHPQTDGTDANGRRVKPRL